MYRDLLKRLRRKTALGLAALMPFLVAASAAAQTVAAAGQQQILADGKVFASIDAAFKAVPDGGIIRIGPGTYREGGTLTKSNVLILADPDSMFDGAVAGGKATFVIRGDNTTIEGMNCKNVRVRDNNGACIRHEAATITLRGVTFADSQQGILAGGNSKKVVIEDSNFLRLGKNGRAHGVYINGGELIIRRSIFRGSKDQAHAIKHRGHKFLLEDSLVASDQADDSRLIDLPAGGDAVVRNNLLIEGPNSVNWSLFSFGVEGVKHEINALLIESNTIIGDRPGGAEFIQAGDGVPRPIVTRNVVIGNVRYDWPASNYRLKDRAEAGLPEGTAIPDWRPPRGP